MERRFEGCYSFPAMEPAKSSQSLDLLKLVHLEKR